MERRMATVNFSLAGGTAGKGAKTCKITLPGSWLAALGVEESHRQMELSFDGTQISLVPLSALCALFPSQAGAGA